MSRDITTSANNAAQSEVIRPVTFIRLNYESGIVTTSSADRDFDFNGETYVGLGNLGTISKIEEAAEVRAMGVTCTLTGIPSEFVSAALGENYQGRDARIYLGFLDGNYTLIADPMLVFQGRMDTQDIRLGKDATISVNIESRLVDWERPRVRRYTNEDQQNQYPGDKGLEFVSQMVEREIVWPGASK
jgi:hypothetical protein